MLDVIEQLYLDDILEKNEWKVFFKRCVYAVRNAILIIRTCAGQSTSGNTQ